jgi:hypothetical protein
MSLEDLARIGEFAGVIAVLVTLLYLSIQVRQSIRETRDQTAWRITESLNQFTVALTSDGETAEIWCRGNDNFDALDRVERERFVVLVAQWGNVLIALYRTRDTSSIPAEYWDHNLETFAIYYATYPGFRKAVEYVNVPDYLLREVVARAELGAGAPGTNTSPAAMNERAEGSTSADEEA